MTHDTTTAATECPGPAARPPLTRGLVVRSAAWSAIQAWGIRFVTLGVFVLLARLLAPQDFGVVAMAAVFVNLVQVLLEHGFGEAIIQKDELTDSHLITAFWLNAGAGLVLFIAVFLLAQPLALLMRESALAECLQALSVTFVMAGLGSVPQAYLKRQFGFKALAMRSLTASLVSSVVAVVLALRGYGVWALVAQNIVFAGIGTVLVWVACDWRPKLAFSLRHAAEIGRFAASSFGTRLVDFLNNRMLDFLIGFFFGAEALGFFTVGSKLVVVFNQMVTFVATQVSLSAFSRLQSEPARFRQAYCSAIKLTSLITFPVFAGLALLAGHIVPLLFGGQWAASIPVLQVYAFMGMLLSTTYLNGTAITALGRPAWLFALSLFEAGSRLLVVLLAVRYGMHATVAAYVVAAALWTPLGYLILRRLLGVPTQAYLRSYLSPVLGICSMAMAIWGLRLAGVMPDVHATQVAVGAVAGAALYVLTAALSDRSGFRSVLGAARGAIAQRRWGGTR